MRRIADARGAAALEALILGPDRTYRSLKGLEKTGSTSRVLNLAALSQRHEVNPEHLRRPLFEAPALAGAVILKHRLRPDERDGFDTGRFTVTKLIMPFERSDLSLGGRSFFVGERGWIESLDVLRGGLNDPGRDATVLEAIDELPSLDPFLLREHLRRRGFDVSPTHFEISPADVERMKRFVGGEIARLIDLAYHDAQGNDASRSRLVEALLASTPDERLEPLRMTLRLEGDSYKEGIFAWKGFLYYKWVLNSLWPSLRDVFSELPKVRIVGPVDSMQTHEIESVRERLRVKMERQVRQVTNLLQVYDRVFERLTVNGDAMAFREFLLDSPKLFLQLGEGCGAVSHIATYWRYQFPRSRQLAANAVQLLDILQGFELSLGNELQARQAA